MFVDPPHILPPVHFFIISIFSFNVPVRGSLTSCGVVLNDINLLAPVFSRWKSIVVVEGNDPISRDYTQSLYHHGWKCTSQQGFFHVWELK